MSGGDLPYSPDKASGNLRVSNFWRDLVERKYKCFDSAYKGIVYQVAVSHNYPEGKGFLISGKHRLKASNISDKNRANYNHIHQFTQSHVINFFLS